MARSGGIRPAAHGKAPIIRPTVCAQTAIDNSGTTPPPNAPRRRNRITPVQWVGLAVLVVLLLNQMGLLSGVTGISDVVVRLPYLLALVLAITIHEFSHGFVATLFGDGLPRRPGCRRPGGRSNMGRDHPRSHAGERSRRPFHVEDFARRRPKDSGADFERLVRH